MRANKHRKLFCGFVQVLDPDDVEDGALFVTDDADKTEKKKLKEGDDEEHDEDMEVSPSLEQSLFHCAITSSSCFNLQFV